MPQKKFATVEEYLESLPEDSRKKTEELRTILRTAFPNAKDGISYNIPALNDGGYFVYYSGYKKHVSLFPAPSGVPEFEADIATYHSGKGTLQFPLKDPLPADLIVRVAQYRLDELKAKKK